MYAYMTSNVRNYNELQVFLKNCHDKKTMEIEINDKIRLTNIELNLFLSDFKGYQKWLMELSADIINRCSYSSLFKYVFVCTVCWNIKMRMVGTEDESI